jgi:hypothetical protein
MDSCRREMSIVRTYVGYDTRANLAVTFVFASYRIAHLSYPSAIPRRLQWPHEMALP